MEQALTQALCQDWRKQFCFFNPTGWNFLSLFIRSPVQLKLNYHGHLGYDTQFFWHSSLLTTEFLGFFQMLSSKRGYSDTTKIKIFKKSEARWISVASYLTSYFPLKAVFTNDNLEYNLLLWLIWYRFH